MNLYKPVTQVAKSVYMPFVIHSVINYGLNSFSETNHKKGNTFKLDNKIHLKAAKTFAYSSAADYLCEGLKGNFIAHQACGLVLKDVISYGVQTLYDSEMDVSDINIFSQEG